MSATSKSAMRNHLDFYQTPTWTTDLLLGYLVENFYPSSLETHFSFTVDVGCGDGAIMERLARHFSDESKIIGVDIDKVRTKIAAQRLPQARVFCRDFLAPPEAEFKDTLLGVEKCLWISNPPFEKAKEVIQQTLFLSKMKDHRRADEACFLLRMGFMSSKKRKAVHQKLGGQMLILPRRPSFCHSFTCREKDGGCGLKLKLSTNITVQICPACDNGKMKLVRTDAADYCWLRYEIEDGEVVNDKTWDIL